MDALLRLTLLKSWLEGHQPHPYLDTREHLYAHVAKNVVGDDVPITFLEFGVYEGASLVAWTQLNTVAASEFIGFDSFEGLPEAWVNIGQTFAPGTFSTGGRLPQLEDPRLRFVKGWFQDTLPSFLSQFHTDKQIIAHCDADLYTSTLYALCQLDKLMRPGAIVIIDDFSSMLHDFRAWQDYTCSFGRQYELLAAAGRTYYEHIAVRFTK